MKMSDIGPLDETFTHIDVDGTQTTYAVTALWRHLEANPQDFELVLLPVDEEHARFCVVERGVEAERLVRLSEHLEWLKKPILMIAFEDGSHLLVDGSHRYVLWFRVGMSHIPCRMVPEQVAKSFVIEDVPQTDTETLMQHSHLVALRDIFGFRE